MHLVDRLFRAFHLHLTYLLIAYTTSESKNCNVSVWNVDRRSDNPRRSRRKELIFRSMLPRRRGVSNTSTYSWVIVNWFCGCSQTECSWACTFYTELFHNRHDVRKWINEVPVPHFSCSSRSLWFSSFIFFSSVLSVEVRFSRSSPRWHSIRWDANNDHKVSSVRQRPLSNAIPTYSHINWRIYMPIDVIVSNPIGAADGPKEV